MRPVWRNPVLWREVRTWAYGRRVLLVHVAFLAIFAIAAAVVDSAARGLHGIRPDSLTAAALNTRIAEMAEYNPDL
jgi:hypothetical protein